MNQQTVQAPTLAALRSITKARQVLQEVVISSESFDYRKARHGLKELEKIIRELGREEARLRAELISTGEAGAQVVPFPGVRQQTVKPA